MLIEMFLSVLKALAANKFTTLAIILLFAFLSVWIASEITNPWPSEGKPARLRVRIDFENQLCKFAWANFHEPEIGPPSVLKDQTTLDYNATERKTYDAAIAAWRRGHFPQVRSFLKLFVVARSPIVIDHNEHYECVGTIWGFGMSYWLVLTLVLLAQVPWFTRACKRSPRAFEVIQKDIEESRR